MLAQEPGLDETKTVLENVERRAYRHGQGRPVQRDLRRSWRTPTPTTTRLAEMGTLQEEIDHQRVDLDSQLEQAMDALNCPPPDADVSVLSGGEKRRVALCSCSSSSPTCCCSTSPPTTSTPRACRARAAPRAAYPGTSSRSPTTATLDNVAELDPRARPRQAAPPYEGNYTTYLEKKKPSASVEGPATPSSQKRLQPGARGCGPTRRRARPRAKRPPRPLRGDGQRGRRPQARQADEIQIPPGPRLGSVVVEAEGLTKAFGDKLLIDDLSFTLPPGGIVGVIGPNGVGKTTLFKMIVAAAEQRRRPAPVTSARRSPRYVDQSRAALDPTTIWQVAPDG